ncbi:alkanesulfonate monooxygenase [Caballeronia hypogeia]|uniref:Alkanesulfonate monooxygenase n=1 Tax=Caballeronia hypogeia TaxID=1777140 RepID=A0A158BUW9_9BURK|nr:alkanesulfonate monooxygenase [Caballeronia hypogeia]
MMSLDVFWFLPTSGDTRYLGVSDFGRAPTNAYMRQIAVAADELGYDGLLVPTGSSCLDPWVTAASLAPVTRRIKLLVALRTSLGNVTASVRKAATLDEALGGRLLLNVVQGGDATELAADGVFLDHEARYEYADEFLRVWRTLFTGESIDFDGEHVRVRGAKNFHEPVQKPYPPLYFGGSSEAAHEIAAEHVDTYLTWGEPPAAVAKKFADVRERAARRGRTVRFGVRLHVIVRETNEEAWAAADSLISRLTDQDIAQSQQNFAKMDSVGQRRTGDRPEPVGGRRAGARRRGNGARRRCADGGRALRSRGAITFLSTARAAAPARACRSRRSTRSRRSARCPSPRHRCAESSTH